MSAAAREAVGTGLIATMDEARALVRTAVQGISADFNADFIVALSRCQGTEGGYARYLASAAFRELFAERA